MEELHAGPNQVPGKPIKSLTPASELPGEPAQSASAVHLCLLLGRILFSFGATTQRVRDSIACLARYLDCNAELAVDYDALQITVKEGTTFQTRINAARSVAGLNFIGLSRVSQLLRGLAKSGLSPADVERELCRIRDAAPAFGTIAHMFAAGCAGWGFCLVNGGDPLSWLGSFIASALVFAIRRPLAMRHFNFHATLLVVALAGSFLGCLLARLTNAGTPVVALIAPILFLVPGSYLINGGIDIIRNQVTTGIARIAFTIAALMALCSGAGLTIRLLPVNISPPFHLPGGWGIVADSIASAVAAAAITCLSNGGWALMALCALGGLTARLVRSFTTGCGLDLVTASLIGVLCSSLLVTVIANRLRWPSVVASMIAALPMIPGYFAIVGLHAILTFTRAEVPDPAQLSVGLQALTRAAFISVALVVGVIGPVIILQRGKECV